MQSNKSPHSDAQQLRCFAPVGSTVIWPKIMKILLLSITLICSFGIPNSAVVNQGAEEVNWSALRVAFERYVNLPTPLNAEEVCKLLPSRNQFACSGEKEERATREYLYSFYQIGMLDRQVISRDRSAVRLAFQLKAIADGAFAEELDIILGKLIRIDPLLFLEELNNTRVTPISFSHLVGNAGPIFVDRQEARCFENRLRIEALETVNKKQLSGLRDKCIMFLKEQYNQYCKDAPH